jgi:hypothetical protein
MKRKGARKECRAGHVFYKSSDCPVCPECEKKKGEGHLFGRLSAPARRALDNAKITSLKKLSRLSEKEILSLHGVGPGSLPALRLALESAGLKFRSKDPG